MCGGVGGFPGGGGPELLELTLADLNNGATPITDINGCTIDVVGEAC